MNNQPGNFFKNYNSEGPLDFIENCDGIVNKNNPKFSNTMDNYVNFNQNSNLDTVIFNKDNCQNFNNNKDLIKQQNIILNKISKNLEQIKLKNYEKKIIVHIDSSIRKKNDNIGEFIVDLSQFNLKNVVNCNILKAAIPKSRQLFKSLNNSNIHNISTVVADGSGTLTGSVLSHDIIDSNYTASELQAKLRSSTTVHLSDTVINVGPTSTLAGGNNINKSGISYLADYTATKYQVIKKMTLELAYVLGFVNHDNHNHYDFAYGFVNNDSVDFNITINDTYVSNSLSSKKSISKINDFLDTFNNTEYFKLGYDNNLFKYFIINCHDTNIITSIKFNQDLNNFSDIIGMKDLNISLKPGEKYYGEEKYYLEFDDNTPNDGNGSTLSTVYQYALIGKYNINFTDTNYVYISIPKLGINQNYKVLTSKGVVNALQSIDMNENYQGITYYRANDVDIIYNKFSPINLNKIEIKLMDDYGNIYNPENNWCATLQFSCITEAEFF